MWFMLKINWRTSKNPGTPGMCKRQRRTFRMTLAASLMAALFLTACGKEEEKENLLQDELLMAQSPNYKTVAVECGEYVKSITGTASELYLVTAELSWDGDNAYYQEIPVRRGQKVKEGDVLAIFNIDSSQVTLEDVKLQLTRAEEDYAEGSTNRQIDIANAQKSAEKLEGYERELADLKIEKQQIEYEQYVYQSERNIARLKERLTELTKEMENTTLVAPFDGVIESVVAYNRGDKVTAGKVLITMYSTDLLVLKADSNVSNLRYNMDVDITISYRKEEKSYTGKVIASPEILPDSVDSELAVIEVSEEIPAEELNGSIRFRCNTEEIQGALMVDRSAVKKENGKSYVYVLQDDTVQKRFVATGPYNNDKIVILDGLTEGQLLIKD